MRFIFQLLLWSCIMTITVHAQEFRSSSLEIGDPAPPLRVRDWLKGAPVKKFENGKVYVVEFWATWCAPCKAAMPHLSALAHQYMESVTVIGIDIYENKITSKGKIKAFVDSMGERMDYRVATQDSNFIVSDWMDASGATNKGIPKAFIVNAEGKLAWIGEPSDLAGILPKIIHNTWDIKEALAKRTLEKRLQELDDSASYELMSYRGDPEKPDDLGNPDSALLVINEILGQEPRLKYAPRIAFHTFSSLLKTNSHKAYEYAKVAMVTYTYDDPPYDVIIGVIELYSSKLNLPAEIYQLGAEAYQAEIDQIPYPEIVDISKLYSKMAEWYWRANDKSKAIDAQQKAIEALKSKNATEMAEFESRLQQYKNR
jgi:thiol-disulfide isomerase/thioredoxin